MSCRSLLEAGRARSTRRVRLRTLSACPRPNTAASSRNVQDVSWRDSHAATSRLMDSRTTVAKCLRIDPVVRRHGRLNPAEINGRKPASRGHVRRGPGLANPGADLIDEVQATQQPSLNGVAKGILGWFCQPSLDVATVRRLSDRGRPHLPARRRIRSRRPPNRHALASRHSPGSSTSATRADVRRAGSYPAPG